MYDWVPSFGVRETLRQFKLCLSSRRTENLPNGRMNKINMAFQAVGNGVAQCANGLLVGTGVSEQREIGIEHLVRFRDRDLDAQPVSGIRERCCGHSILIQPFIDLFQSLGSRCNESFGLTTITH